MSRGDGREDLFQDEMDRQDFLQIYNLRRPAQISQTASAAANRLGTQVPR